jgi:hypothetical protein
MAKRFMYVCIGILALVVSFHMGARYGTADTIVDHSATGIVAVDADRVLLDDGEVWQCDQTGYWYRQPEYDLPVPVSEVRFWSCYPPRFWTTSSERWNLIDGQWVNLGSPPGGVATQSTTWGEIKAGFK